MKCVREGCHDRHVIGYTLCQFHRTEQRFKSSNTPSGLTPQQLEYAYENPPSRPFIELWLDSSEVLPKNKTEFFRDILAERERQREKFPRSIREQRPHLNRWERMSIYMRLITEEVGEVCNAVEKTERQECRTCNGRGDVCSGACRGAGYTPAELPFSEIRKELIQVAALCLRMIEEEGL